MGTREQKIVRFASGGDIDAFAWTTQRNYGAISGARNVTSYRSHADDGIERQTSVYERAKIVDTEINFDLIIDLGCGSDEKTLSRFADSGKLIHVDLRDRRTKECQDKRIPFYSACFESYDDLEILQTKLPGDARVLIICSDVIEHIFDPRPLLSTIRQLLMRNPGNRAIISTPDHERVDGAKEGQFPINKEHVRQWSVYNFGSLLRSIGFQILEYGLCKMNDFSKLNNTIYAEVSCSRDAFNSFLSRANLPPPARRLLITSEHKLAGRSGGIGAYAYQSERILPGGTITLMTTSAHSDRLHDPDGLSKFLFVEEITGTAVDTLSVLEAVKFLVFLYPEIAVIEYQDYLGLGHAIGQAAQGGILPTRIATVCYCHGNHVYLEVNHGRFNYDHTLHLREKLTIETAQYTLFPSNYLERLYHRTGSRPQRTDFLASPYQFQFPSPSENEFKRIDTIIFYGKRTIGKGYKVFVDAINILANRGKLHDIEQIIVAGVGDEEFEFAPSLNGRVENKIYKSDEAVQQMRAVRDRALAVLPYLGDNFPLSIHELIDAGVQTILSNAGGMPEVIADCDPQHATLCKPDPESLASLIGDKLNQSGFARSQEVLSLGHRFRELQKQRNSAFVEFFAALGNTEITKCEDLPDYQVVITYHNEPPRFIQDCLDGLAFQFKPPIKVVFVDDASSEQNSNEARALIAGEKRLPVQYVATPKNLGLAGARNFGMKFVDTDFLVVHDVDNVLRSDAAMKMLRAITRNSDTGAVTTHSRLFSDDTDWMDRETRISFYTPIGADLSEPAMNNFGDALAMYRCSAIEAMNGWRVSLSEHEIWEDFELFYRMTLANLRIAILPEPTLQYRVRPDSMLRSYAAFGGILRMAEMLNEAVPGAGFAILRRAAQRRELAPPVGIAMASNTVQAINLPLSIVFAALPRKLRSDLALRSAAGRGSKWRKLAVKRPFSVSSWQAIRRLSRLRKRSNGALDQFSTLDLAIAVLPRQLRSQEALLEAASMQRSWKVHAFRHPFKIEFWQAVRRIQRHVSKHNIRI